MRVQKRGQAISEYLILTALIAIASIGIVQVLGHNLQTRLAYVSEALRGSKKKLEGTEAKEKHYQVRDLSDFNEGMQDNAAKE